MLVATGLTLKQCLVLYEAMLMLGMHWHDIMPRSSTLHKAGKRANEQSVHEPANFSSKFGLSLSHLAKKLAELEQWLAGSSLAQICLK